MFENAAPEAIDRVLNLNVANKARALVLRGSPFFSTPQRKIIVERVTAHRIPAIYETREFVELGGLMSYGTNFSELFRLAAKYVTRILGGANVHDLPIEQANTFELLVNARAARMIGITVPPALIARADEVIE